MVSDFPPLRKRKTKAPCPGCFMHPERCFCEMIPELRLRTRLALIIHAKELKRTTNTGRIALKVLNNSEMRVRGETKEPVDLSGLLSDEYQSLFFFPSATATDLSKEFVAQFAKPIQLIVPDGNWRQASKVWGRHPELQNIPCVKISEPNLAKNHLRAETTAEGMSTLEAIAKAFRVLEGEEVFAKLNDVYQLKLQRTLEGRGGREG